MSRFLFRLLASTPAAADPVPDGELLRRFVASNDSAAFELLVRRHAGAVWAATWRILKTESDAEDAFQATFLALIRRAKHLRTPCVGAWLHRVAVNAALKLRQRASRTSPVEPTELTAVPAPDTAAPDTDWVGAVHEELARLPERERLPVVLCDLEGLTHAEAAQALGWPVGTVSGRLSRARARLRQYLERRGLASSSAALSVALCPARLVPNAASLIAGGAPPAVVSLTDGVLAMTSTTWKWVAAAVVCTGALGAGGVLAFEPGVKVAPQPVAPPDAPVAARNEPPAKDKTAEGDWTPKRLRAEVPTAFPDIKPPADNLAERCPRVFGKKPIVVGPTDPTAQRLLKARAHQCCLELAAWAESGNVNGAEFRNAIQCRAELLDALGELWRSDSSLRPELLDVLLVPWIEELLIAAKFDEDRARRLLQETKDPMRLHGTSALTLAALTRHRLAVESALLLRQARLKK
jgi:RNA polymerase sigma factor (sigma-70 family)